MPASCPDEVSPVIQVTRGCPLCEHSFRAATINPELFQVKTTEIDLKPVYQWQKRIFSRCNPEIYTIAICPKCGFSGDENAFIHPLRNLGFTLKSFRSKAKEILAGRAFGEVAGMLKATNDSAPDDYPAGIRRFMQAIFFLEQFAVIRECDALPLARYCLHLSWLYSDMDRTGYRQDLHRALLELRQELSAHWAAPPINHLDALRLALKYYDTSYYNSSHIADDGHEISILQLIGRIHLRLGEHKTAQDVFFSCIKSTNERVLKLKREMNAVDTPAETRTALLPVIHELNHFITQSRDLLALTRHK